MRFRYRQIRQLINCCNVGGRVIRSICLPATGDAYRVSETSSSIVGNGDRKRYQRIAGAGSKDIAARAGQCSENTYQGTGASCLATGLSPHVTCKL